MTLKKDFLWLFFLIIPVFACFAGNSDEAEKYCQKGDEMSTSRNFTEAITYYSIALEKDVNCSDAYYKRGICFVKTAHYEEAINDFNNFLKLTGPAQSNREAVKSLICALGSEPLY